MSATPHLLRLSGSTKSAILNCRGRRCRLPLTYEDCRGRRSRRQNIVKVCRRRRSQRLLNYNKFRGRRSRQKNDVAVADVSDNKQVLSAYFLTGFIQDTDFNGAKFS